MYLNYQGIVSVTLFKKRNMQNDLARIKCNFCFITQSLLKSENSSFLLDVSFEIVESTKFKLSQNKRPITEADPTSFYGQNTT
jgi:hypothetical protein